ncbi:hypothetical protein NE237_008918 [Protea cynaroides]|uniref:PHD-type domain-containing protein n=1 Tax=Protea cynaroides TaxID=273540 RepID=A0A9Q0KWK6_9MAGN|nr:hypothetical protein NE237_008918 [Protea cynaroides]
MTGSGEEEGRKLKFVCRPWSGSNIGVENTKGDLHGSTLDNNVGTCSTGCGSVLGFSHFASLHGGFSGVSERINLIKKEGRLGTNGKRVHDTSRKNQKRAALEEDRDRLPEQGSFIQSPGAKNRGDSVGKRSRKRYNRDGKDPFGELDGVDVSKPGSQSTSASNNQKHLLLAAGWTVVSRLGHSDLLYVSPSGSVYGSLSKALEAFSPDASGFREKECNSYQSGYTGGRFGDSDLHGHSSDSNLVAKNIHEGKGTVDQMAEIGSPVEHVDSKDMLLQDQGKIKKSLTKVPLEMVSNGVQDVVACSKVNEKTETHIKNGSFSSETKKLNYSIVVMSKGNHHDDVEIQKRASSNGAMQSVLINGKPLPVDDQIGMEIREDEDLFKLSKDEVFMTGNLLLQKPQTHKETREEALLMADETRCKQLFDVVAVDEKVNQENRNPDDCSRVAIKGNQSIVNINQDGKLHRVRRSERINGRHVPVYTDLDIDIWDDNYYLDSCDYVNTFTTDLHLGTQEPDDKIAKEASPMPKEIRYKVVNEVSTFGITDANALLEKQKPDEGAHNKLSAVQEELGSEEIHKQSVFHVEDGKGKTCTFVDLLSQDMLPLDQGTGNESDNEVLPMVRERRYRELHDILVSCMADGNAKSCTECSSKGGQMLDSRRRSMANNGKDRDGDMHGHGEGVELRRSKRIDGKHVPVDGEFDIDTWVFDDLLDLSMFVDDRVENKDEEKSANSNSEMVSIVIGLPATGFLDELCIKNVKPRSACSISEMVNLVVGLPAPGWLKQTAATKSEHQKPRNQEPVKHTAIMKSGNWKPRNQEQLDSNGTLCIHAKVLKNYLGVKTPLSEKVSSLLLDNVTEAFKQTAMWESDNQKIRNQEQNQELSEQSATRKSDNQTPRNQEQLDSNSPLCVYEKKKSRVKTLVAETGSPSLLNNGTQTLITEKRSPLSLTKRKRVGGGYSNGKKKKRRRGGCGLVVRRSGKGDIVSETKCSMLSWLIDNGALAEGEKVFYKIKNGKGNITKGSITRGGIRCNCCRKVWSLLEFEAHAGSNIHQPWFNTCLISGKSLMQYQIEAWEKQKKERKLGFQTVGAGDADPTDDTCGICADGGHLICCDGCLSTFHQECVMLKSLPEGSWYCPYCRCAFCMLADSGHDILSQNFSMCCCNQCGCKYHRDCVVEKDKDAIFLNSLSFCGENCRKVAMGLSDILGVSNPLDGGFSWTLLKRLDEDEDVGSSSDQRLSFIMGCNIKLALALSALHECFVPLVDPRSGLDMIVQAVYNCGSNYNRLNCERFYTMVLEKDEEIISVATLRLHGTRLSEMPFIGTRPIYRRQGMCRRLLNSIEKMLSSLHVEKLIIPAIPDLLGTWMTSFSFTPLESSHREEIRNLSMMLFADTILLQKSLCNSVTNEASGRLALVATSRK